MVLLKLEHLRISIDQCLASNFSISNKMIAHFDTIFNLQHELHIDENKIVCSHPAIAPNGPKLLWTTSNDYECHRMLVRLIFFYHIFRRSNNVSSFDVFFRSICSFAVAFFLLWSWPEKELLPYSEQLCNAKERSCSKLQQTKKMSLFLDRFYIIVSNGFNSARNMKCFHFPVHNLYHFISGRMGKLAINY